MDTLLGRDRELSVIDDAIARVVRGERSVVMLTGEPGIGKTRLLDELARRATAHAVTVVWGRALEVGLTPAYWPWHEILGALEASGDPAPALGSAAGETNARFAQWQEVAAYLARRAPLALVFDDAHAADPSSLQLLEHLVRRTPALFAIAARDGDADRDAATVLGRIQRGAQRLPLARLAREHVDALVARGGADRAHAERVWELSEGNPLFVEELVATSGISGARLPAVSSVRAVIRDRIARLPVEVGEALVAGAVVGREFRGRVVADILGRELDLAPAVQLGMVAVTSSDRYRFSHALVAEALADELDASARARYHLRAAQAIEKREGSVDAAAAIAHHLLAAGHLAAEAAVVAAERAAATALAELAFEDAAALLDRAIGALGLAAPDDRRRRATLLCAQAEALQLATQHGRATALCDSAAAIARSLGDRELLARVALVRGLEWRFGRAHPQLVEELREALPALPDGALRTRVLARLAAAEQPAPDPREPIARALAAIELGRTLPARDRMAVFYVATAALIDYVDPDTLEPILAETLDLARGTDRWIGVHTRLRACFVALDHVDRTVFDRAVAAFTADAEALGLPQWTRHTHMLASLAAVLEGRFADAEHHVAAAEAISATLGDPNAPWIVAVHRVMTSAIRTVAPDPALETAVGTHPAYPTVIATWFAALRGDRTATRAALATIPDLTLVDPELCVMVAHAVALVGHRELAATIYDLLVPRTGRIAAPSLVGCNVLELCDRILLVMATTLERWDVIDEHAERALAVATKLASPVWTARIRADHATALALRGRPGDAARAAELGAVALADAERLGMPGVVAQCRALTARPAAPVMPAPRVTFERAGELWLVTGFAESVHVKDSRGVQMLARLVDKPGHEIHALDLGGGRSGDAVDGGHAGELLDARAKAQYRERLAELTAERDRAEAFHDQGRLARATAEIEALTAELSRAVGRGGRDRVAGSAAERARTNVQRRVAYAVQAIRAVSPRIAEHLAATVHTGTYCIYDPAR